jgi:glutathione synthase
MSIQSLKIGYVIDPIERLNFKKDTTLALMRESQKRGFQNYTITLPNLFLEDDKPIALAERIELDGPDDYQALEKGLIALEELDVILMRKDPPFDVEYIMATYILDRLKGSKTIVLNNPQSLRDLNEKVMVSRFPDIVPPNLLTSSGSRALDFMELHGKVVVKPTNKMGGQSIYILQKGDPNIAVILEDMTLRGRRYVVLQKFIPEISQDGDQRILLINGNPVDCGVARIPIAGDHRGNLVCGAKASGFKLTARHLKICDTLSPYLLEKGLFFVGIDVIGGFLTEVNITSPTGILEIDKIFGINVARIFFDALLETYFH